MAVETRLDVHGRASFTTNQFFLASGLIHLCCQNLVESDSRLTNQSMAYLLEPCPTCGC
jgi:hypothetical protein